MKAICTTLALVVATGLPLCTQAQRLEAAGVAASFNISQTWARQRVIEVRQYTFETDIDGSRLDDTGNRFSAFARVGVGGSRVFVQPELAYTSVLGNQSRVSYYPYPDVPFANVSYLYPRLRRAELAALAGWHVGRKVYLLAGPVLARYGREADTEINSEFEALQVSILDSHVRWQALAQLGIGWQLGRFDLNARYERSLTPYSRSFSFQGRPYDYRQRSGQVLFSLGFVVYDRHRPWRK